MFYFVFNSLKRNGLDEVICLGVKHALFDLILRVICVGIS